MLIECKIDVYTNAYHYEHQCYLAEYSSDLFRKCCQLLFFPPKRNTEKHSKEDNTNCRMAVRVYSLPVEKQGFVLSY